jgi:hypothetical protein
MDAERTHPVMILSPALPCGRQQVDDFFCRVDVHLVPDMLVEVLGDPAAWQVGDQVLCPGNIATAGRERVGTVTRLGSTYHGELRRLLGRAPDPMPAASRA